MNSIKNIKQLKLEILRLEISKNKQEEKLLENWKEIKESFKPINLIFRTIPAFFAREKDDKTLLKEGINWGVNLLTEKLLFKRSYTITKSLVGYFLKAIASKVINRKSESVIDRIKSVFKKNSSTNDYYPSEEVLW